MSMRLSYSRPTGIEFKTHGIGEDEINVRTPGSRGNAPLKVDFDLSQEDFCRLVRFYLEGKSEGIVIGVNLVASFEAGALEVTKLPAGVICHITEQDWCVGVRYVFTNTNLRKDDPRLKFVEGLQSKRTPKDASAPRQELFEKLKGLQVANGYFDTSAPNAKRLTGAEI